MLLSELSRYFVTHQRTYNKPNSVRSCALVMRTLEKVLGDFPVEEMTQEQVQTFISKRREAVKPISVNADLRYLKALLRFGESFGYLDSVPVKIRMLRCPRKRELRLLTPQEIHSLIKNAPGHWKVVLQLAAVTGMRIGEILALRHRDILTEEARLVVRGENAKSHQHRSIPLSQKTLILLQEHRKRARLSGDADLMFASRRGGQISPTNAARSLRNIWVKAGLYQKGTPLAHHLRHGAASNMLRNGADLETVREIMGHADITTTSLYLHSSTEQKRTAIAGLEI